MASLYGLEGLGFRVRVPNNHMSYSLSSLRGHYIGGYIGDNYADC